MPHFLDGTTTVVVPPPPVVSVLMPVYNAERFVLSALQSMLNQTFSQFELLLLDDGSTDRSLCLIKSSLDPRVKIYSREHRGLTATRNELLGLASGEFVALMDADDISSSDRLEQQLAFLRVHPAVGAVGSAGEYINDDDVVIRGGPRLPCSDSAIRLQSFHVNCFINGSVMFRRNAATGLCYRDLAPVEDYDFWLRLSERCAVANIPETLYQYRIHDASTTSRTERRTREWLPRRIRQLAVQRLLTGSDDLEAKTPILTEYRQLRQHTVRSTEAYATLCAWMIEAFLSGRYRLASRLARASISDKCQNRRLLRCIATSVFSKSAAATIDLHQYVGRVFGSHDVWRDT